MYGDKLSGKIVHYSDDKKFGFIKPDGGDDGDIFFHLSACEGGISPGVGDRVEFIAESDPRHRDRRRAKGVVLL